MHYFTELFRPRRFSLAYGLTPVHTEEAGNIMKDEIHGFGNPIIANQGVCDPHIHVFAGRAYLYASHDADKANSEFVMHDWQIWSSENLVQWRFESTLRPEDTYIGKSSACWAVDAAERNGKYYLYFSNGTRDTGVAVSDSPGGPFIDALGYPLLREDLTPTRQYDPSIFVDDDAGRTPYIVFGTPVWAGGDSYYIARLNDDMISLAEPPRKIDLDDGADDKPFLHKRNGRYYLSWASFYAVSDSVYGPYCTQGSIAASPDHGSFFEWNGQSYHAFTVLDPTHHFRATGLCYLHYRADGSMACDQFIVEHGAGHYDARWNRIEAVWFSEASETPSIRKVENLRYGFDVLSVPPATPDKHGSQDDHRSQDNRQSQTAGWIRFPRIHHVPNRPAVALFAANTGREDAEIEVRWRYPDGPLLGRVQIRASGVAHWRSYASFVTELDLRGVRDRPESDDADPTQQTHRKERGPGVNHEATGSLLDLCLVFTEGPTRLSFFRIFDSDS